MNRFLILICSAALLTACNRLSLDDKIYQQTRDYTKTSCPKRMDQYTVLDSMVYVSASRTMVYHYSVSDKMDVDSVYTTQMIDLFDTNLLNNVRQNPGLNELKEHAVTFHYIYSSQTNGKEYMSFTYTPDKYQPDAR